MFLSKTKWKWKGLAGRDHPTPGRDPCGTRIVHIYSTRSHITSQFTRRVNQTLGDAREHIKVPQQITTASILKDRLCHSRRADKRGTGNAREYSEQDCFSLS